MNLIVLEHVQFVPFQTIAICVYTFVIICNHLYIYIRICYFNSIYFYKQFEAHDEIWISCLHVFVLDVGVSDFFLYFRGQGLFMRGNLAAKWNSFVHKTSEFIRVQQNPVSCSIWVPLKMYVFDDFSFDTRFVDPSFPETKVSVYSQTYLQFKVMSSETFRDKAWCIVYLGAFSLTHSAVGHILPKYQQLLAFPTFP